MPIIFHPETRILRVWIVHKVLVHHNGDISDDGIVRVFTDREYAKEFCYQQQEIANSSSARAEFKKQNEKSIISKTTVIHESNAAVLNFCISYAFTNYEDVMEGPGISRNVEGEPMKIWAISVRNKARGNKLNPTGFKICEVCIDDLAAREQAESLRNMWAHGTDGSGSEVRYDMREIDR